ncbi:phosphoadenosine phosphosulfate reductase family protein [Persephonella sp.]
MKKLIVVNYSGGKDSTACLIKALKEYPKEMVIPLFADTGWEHPLLYQYLDYIEKELDIRIVRVKSDKYIDVLDVIEKKKIFPSSIRRICTDKLKREPLMKFLYSLKEKGYEIEEWLGMRADESQNRKQRYGHISPDEVFEIHDIFPSLPKKYKGIKVRFPVIDLSAKEIYRIISDAGIEVNPLYHKGYERVGCFPCVIAGLKDYKKVWRDEIGKQRILKLVELEEKLNKAGYRTTLKPDKSGQEILRMLKMRDRQNSLFEDENVVMCGFCHY